MHLILIHLIHSLLLLVTVRMFTSLFSCIPRHIIEPVSKTMLLKINLINKTFLIEINHIIFL